MTGAPLAQANATEAPAGSGTIADALPPVLTCGQVAKFMGYMRKAPRDHEPNRELIRRLVRSGKFPSPIDDQLSTVHWRWNLEVVLSYRDGTWTAPKPKARAS